MIAGGACITAAKRADSVTSTNQSTSGDITSTAGPPSMAAAATAGCFTSTAESSSSAAATAEPGMS